MLFANSAERKDHLREVFPSEYLEAAFPHHVEEGKFDIPSEGDRFDTTEIDKASKNNWSPPSTTSSDSPAPASVAESLPQDPKSTTLPSFKELEALPRYIRTPQLEMSPVPQTGHSTGNEPHQDKYKDRETFSTSHYPYSHRYLQGEPNYPSATAPYHRSPSVSAAMLPYEIPRTVHPANLTRPSHVFPRTKPTRGDAEYLKRPRRRAEEVERLYDCNFPGCTKAYGALNHLNTHVRDAQHGPKREPKEFKDIRREQKAKSARERQQNTAMYRIVGTEMLHSHEQRAASPYGQLPTPIVYPRSMPQELERPLYHPYSGYSGRHFSHGNGISQEWRPASPSQIPTSARWSPDNYYDLHHRHPSFAKDLIAERPHSRENTHVSRDGHLLLNGDRYESFGYSSYVQGPNGPVKTGDSYHYAKKEF